MYIYIYIYTYIYILTLIDTLYIKNRLKRCKLKLLPDTRKVFRVIYKTFCKRKR